MVESYANSLNLPVPKERVVTLFTDPYWLAGATGHIAVLAVYSRELHRYVQLSHVSAAPNRFRVVYVLGRIEEKLQPVLGELDGPHLSPSGVSYTGHSDDMKLKWALNLNITQTKPGETSVEFTIKVSMTRDFLDTIVKTPGFLGRHIIEDHLIPYLKLYVKPVQVEQPRLKPTKLLEKWGPVSSLVREALRVANNVSYGVIAVRGKDFWGKITIKNGRPVEIEANDSLGKLTGEQALVKFGTTIESGYVVLYSLNVDALATAELNKVAEAAWREETELLSRDFSRNP
ncbi:MAG: hypothetical protein ACP5HQ_06820 [Thermoprotei archaeon]